MSTWTSQCPWSQKCPDKNCLLILHRSGYIYNGHVMWRKGLNKERQLPIIANGRESDKYTKGIQPVPLDMETGPILVQCWSGISLAVGIAWLCMVVWAYVRVGAEGEQRQSEADGEERVHVQWHSGYILICHGMGQLRWLGGRWRNPHTIVNA